MGMGSGIIGLMFLEEGAERVGSKEGRLLGAGVVRKPEGWYRPGVAEDFKSVAVQVERVSADTWRNLTEAVGAGKVRAKEKPVRGGRVTGEVEFRGLGEKNGFRARAVVVDGAVQELEIRLKRFKGQTEVVQINLRGGPSLREIDSSDGGRRIIMREYGGDQYDEWDVDREKASVLGRVTILRQAPKGAGYGWVQFETDYRSRKVGGHKTRGFLPASEVKILLADRKVGLRERIGKNVERLRLRLEEPGGWKWVDLQARLLQTGVKADYVLREGSEWNFDLDRKTAPRVGVPKEIVPGGKVVVKFGKQEVDLGEYRHSVTFDEITRSGVPLMVPR